VSQLGQTNASAEVAAALPLEPERRRPVNLRSVGVGLVAVILICALTPFNDYVLNSTPLIGGSLPVALVLFFFGFALLVNGPLSRYAPSRAFTSGEMTVILVMILVACVIPGAGLMQFWQPTIVGTYRHTLDKPAEFEQLFKRLNLPDWFWVKFPASAKTLGEKASDDIITHYYNRIPDDLPFWATFGGYLRRWMPPTVGWLVFLFGLFTSVIGLSFVLRRQWVENERIAFPIAQVQMSLIETPPPGRFFNSTFASRAFWIGLGLMLFLRGLEGFNKYFPKYVPVIALKYDIRDILSEPPWMYVNPMSLQTLYPLMAALVFFVSTRIAFSLWAIPLLWQVPQMIVGTTGAQLPRDFARDANGGSLLAFALMILWTGRHHYGRVIRLMFWRRRADEEPGLFIHHRTAGWMTLGGAVLACLWLLRVGMTPMGAILLVGGLLMTWLVMAFVVAHSGFITAVTLSGPREWFADFFPHNDPKNNYQVGVVRNHFHVQTIGGMWAYPRDQELIYATHGLKVATERAPRAGRSLLAAIALAMLVGFAVAHLASLYCYYKYDATQDKLHATPINAEVLEGQPKWQVNYVLEAPHTRGQQKRHSSLTDWIVPAGSFSLTSLFAFLQLRYAWWPLHPIGLLMLFAFSMKRLWFSILVGWLAKVLVVRFGGASLFTRTKPFFIGVIVGEVVAAGLLALSAIVLHLLGLEFEVVRFLPTSQF